MIRVLLLLCAGSYILADKPIEKCKITEHSCIVKVSNDVYSKVANEPNSGLDPMYPGVIEGRPKKLYYKFTDSIVSGYKTCTVEDANMDISNLRFDFTFLCSRITMEGKYNISGQIFDIPVEGSGDYVVEAPNFRITVHSIISLEGNVTQTHLQIKSFTFDTEPLEPIQLKFDNLFNGNKELSDQIQKFANENWKGVAKEVQDPSMQAQLNILVSVANNTFKRIYMQQYLIL